MRDKLKEMILVVRPTKGDGRIPIGELSSILFKIGFDFLTEKTSDLTHTLDPSRTGYFQQDDLIDLLMKDYIGQYTSRQNLRQALAVFDYDNDGKIQFEELEYFLKNFGESEQFYIDEKRMKQMLDMAKPLDKNGYIDIERYVESLTSCWKYYQQ